MNITQKILIVSILGIVLAYYTVHVKIAKTQDPNYKCYCDFNKRFSCSEVFISKFANGFMVIEKILGPDSFFNLPNGVFGILSNLVIIGACFMRHQLIAKIQLLLSSFSGLFALAGFYNAFFISPVLCIVCLVLHSNNLCLFLLCWKNHSNISKGQVRLVKGKVK